MKNYPYLIKPLSSAEGGGYLIEYPDLPGCISDGDSEAEAILNGKDAVKEWLAAAKKMKREIPKPGVSLPSGEFSGKYLQRLPKSLHEELSKRAKFEGVSINQLTLSYISRGLGLDTISNR